MEISFDPTKDAANLAKHGLSFADFQGFDADPVMLKMTALTMAKRAIAPLAGLTESGSLVFTVTETGIRAISFRRAHEKEMRRHEQE